MQKETTCDNFYVIRDNKQTPGMSDFTQQLYREINLPENEYECALCDLEFTPKRRPLFGNRFFDGEFKMRVGEDTKSTHRIKKRTDDIVKWISFANSSLSSRNIGFGMDYSGNNPRFVVNNNTEKILVLDKNAAESFGFLQNEFGAGKTTATRNLSPVLFSKIPNPTGITIAFVTKSILYQFNFLEYQDEDEKIKSIEDVVTALNYALLQKFLINNCPLAGIRLQENFKFYRARKKRTMNFNSLKALIEF